MIDKSISIIIPAYNEEKAIKNALEKLKKFMQSNFTDFEIIVVNDASSDQTKEIMETIPGIYLVNHPYNKGNGAAVRSGIRAAKKDYVIMLDADGQHDENDLLHIANYLGDFDCVVGARTGENGSFHRNLANRFYNYLATYVTNIKIEDLTSGMRGFRRSVIKKFLYMFPNGFSYPTTSTMAIIKAGYNIKYHPIIARKRIGTSKIRIFRDGFRFLMIIAKVTTLFSPMKIFLPLSLISFLAGILHGSYKIIVFGMRYSQLSVLLVSMGVLMFLIGLISEQITTLRYSRLEED